MTERSRRFVLINHCSVFDLSFAKGAKARRRVARAEEGKKKRKKKGWGGGVWTRSNRYAKSRRCHNTFLMKSEINQLHGLLDESGTS